MEKNKYNGVKIVRRIQIDMRHGLKITYNAPTTLTFVILCGLATLLGVISGGTITQTFFMTWHSSLRDILTYPRFFTHVLGHSDWSHFFGNATYLLLLGPLLEEKYGSRTMWESIGLTALATGLVNYIFFPTVALCGASGVVFAFILMASFTSFRQGEIPLTFILIAIIYIGDQILQGVFIEDNISHMAHIVGGVVGALIAYNLNKPRRR